MAVKGQDAVDLMCHGWAATRRAIHGISRKQLEPAEMLGRMKCTLGRVKEDREGAAAGIVSQHFPEAYSGTSLVVHRCWTRMRNGLWKQVMDAHFVWREVDVIEKAKFLHVTKDKYYDALGMLKAHVDGFVSCYVDMDDDAPKAGQRRTAIREFA